jgi:UDPglucose--hexose-1-phosphate uridylyltransferase
MAQFELSIHPHRRFNPLTHEWVLVSPHRTERPWQGQVEPSAASASPSYDPRCYLCPGNARAGGHQNPKYTSTFVFDNDFAALRPDTPSGELREGDLLLAKSESGRCRVVCFTPRHDLTLARMGVSEIRTVVDTWCDEFSKLAAQPNVRAIQIFENRGAMMGCSNPHPHGQIWVNQNVPDELAREVTTQDDYFQAHHSTLLEDYLSLELQTQERLVCNNDHFAAMVPFWAVWPYETLLISRRRVGSLTDLQDAERTALADVLRQIVIRYDNLFKTPFPYTMGFHQHPVCGSPSPGFHLHAHFYPPLLRSATIRKFMVGYEMLAMPQRDISPELAGRQLRELPAVHYLDTQSR